MSHVIICPSGIGGCIRSMEVREERVLADWKTRQELRASRRPARRVMGGNPQGGALRVR